MTRRRLLLAALTLCLLVAYGYGARGAAAPSPTGTLFVVDRREDRVLVIDASTGAIRTVRPPGMAKCGPGLHATGGRLVYVGSSSRSSNAYSVDPRPGGERIKLGGAHELVPSETPGRVWLSKVARCHDVMRLGSVQEVTVDGHVTARSRGPVPGFRLVGALADGVVMEGQSSVVAWSPATGRVSWRHPGVHVVATGGRTVAWSDYSGHRPLRLTDIGSGRTRPVSAPRGWSLREAYDGAMSSDRKFLATSIARGRGVRRLALVDVSSGAVQLVARSRVARDYAAITWSESGWVFFHAGGGKLMGYRPGAEHAVRLPVKLEHGVFQMAAG